MSDGIAEHNSQSADDSFSNSSSSANSGGCGCSKPKQEGSRCLSFYNSDESEESVSDIHSESSSVKVEECKVPDADVESC